MNLKHLIAAAVKAGRYSVDRFVGILFFIGRNRGKNRNAKTCKGNNQSNPCDKTSGPKIAEPSPDLQLQIRLGSKFAARNLVLGPDAQLSIASGGKVLVPEWEKNPTKLTLDELLEAERCWHKIKEYREQFPEWDPDDLSVHGAAKLYWFPKLLSHAMATISSAEQGIV